MPDTAEAIFIFILSVLPGFLTEILVSSRSDRFKRQRSTFRATAESLLRSAYIHLVTLIVFALVWKNEINMAFSSHLSTLAIPIGQFNWMIIAFAFALLFGLIWDPLDFAMMKINQRGGRDSTDPWERMKRRIAFLRKLAGEDHTIWIQARMKNGLVYQGEFSSITYTPDERIRELSLVNVSLFSATPLPGEVHQLDGLIIELANCEGVEVLYARQRQMQARFIQADS